MATLLPVYEDSCRASHVPPNSALCNYFAASSPTEPLHVLSLSCNLIGPRGLHALLPVLQLCRHTLHSLDLSYNDLGNDAIRRLSRWLLFASDDGFPALRRLELKGNPFTYQAGKCLAHCCEGVRPAGVDVAADAAETSNSSDAAADGVDSKGTSKAPCYWLEAPGMNIDYIGVEETLMPHGLQRALHNRIVDAIARREQRRRRQRQEIQQQQRPQRGSFNLSPSQNEEQQHLHEKKGSRSKSSSSSSSSSRHCVSSVIEGGDVPTSEDAAMQPSSLPTPPQAPTHTPADLFDELDSEVEGNKEEEQELEPQAGAIEEDGTHITMDQRGSAGIERTNPQAHENTQDVKEEEAEEDAGGSSITEVPHMRGGNASTMTRSSTSVSRSRDDSEADHSHISTAIDVSRRDTAHTAVPLSRPSASASASVEEVASRERSALHSIDDGVAANTRDRQETPLVAPTATPPSMVHKAASDILDELSLELQPSMAEDVGDAPSWLDEM